MAGRKNLYKKLVEPFLADINKKIREGVTESEIAKALGISVATLANYKNQHPELVEALSKGKGKDVLQRLVNAGIESACGCYKENETTTIVKNEDTGEPEIKQKTITRTWYPPNQSLNKFYVLNFGRDEGWSNDPNNDDLKKQAQEFDQALKREKNWDIDFDDK